MRAEANVSFGSNGAKANLNEGFVRGTLSMPNNQIEQGFARMLPVVERLHAVQR